jgi:hypothetical protein
MDIGENCDEFGASPKTKFPFFTSELSLKIGESLITHVPAPFI